MRVTKQKTAIMNALVCGKHMTSEEVYELVKKSMDIDLSTVYRNLNSMYEMGILEKVNNSEGTSLFCMKINHHGHLICLKCNNVYEIPCNLCSELHDISSQNGFEDKEHVINIYGYCNKCRNREDKE